MNASTTPEPITVLVITGTDAIATSQVMSTQWRITRGTEYLGLVTPKGRTGHEGWWIVEGHHGVDFPSLQAAGEYLVSLFPAAQDDLVAQRRELAAVIAGQAQAIADGTVAHESAAVARLLDNVQTLRAWTPQP